MWSDRPRSSPASNSRTRTRCAPAAAAWPPEAAIAGAGTEAGSHAILVFGCPADAAGRPLPPLLRRLRRAFQAAMADPEARLILSGGAVEGPCEAEVMAAWLTDQGVAPGRLVLEPHARDTLDNALRCAALVAAAGIGRVTLVTDRYHARRSAMLLTRALTRRGLHPVLEVACATGGGSNEASVLERIKLRLDLGRLWLRPR